jgi:C4-dicarboxylate-specific signal transduction histidine kinase
MWSNQKVIGTLSLASAAEKTVEDQFMNWITSAANYIAAFIARKQVEDAMLEAQKLESLGVLASGVAHDFNNLLTGILAESALALNKLDSLNPARQNLARVVQTTRRAADLTGQLLAYSGRGHLQMRLLDLNALVRENLTLLQTSVPRSVTLNTHLMPDLPSVKADMGQMQQVIMNLIINAAEAYEGQPGTVWLRTGTITVDAKYQTSRVLGQVLPPGRYVSLMVQDSGKGMTEDVLARIFDPFFTTKFTGRGLGLAAVLGVIRGHSGTSTW